MDVETSTAIEQLGERIDGVERSLTKRMDSVEQSLTKRIDSVGNEIRELRDEMNTGFRRVDIQFEAIRDDIRMLAEGVAHLAAKIDRTH